MLMIFKESEVQDFRNSFSWNGYCYTLVFLRTDDSVSVEMCERHAWYNPTRVFRLVDSRGCFWSGGRIDDYKDFDYIEGEVPVHIYQRHMEALLINWHTVKSDLEEIAAQRREALNSFVL